MEEPVKLYVPISITYSALEDVLRNQFVGGFIPKSGTQTHDSPYAQILDLGISGSSTSNAEVIVNIKIKVLRTVLKRDQVDLYALASVGYDNASQQLYVNQFKLNVRTSSGFYNTALEVLVNKVAYSQILQEARIDLKEIIGEEVTKVNRSLQEGIELKGLKIKGAVSSISVLNVIPEQNKVSCAVEVKGDLQVDILDLLQVMPAKSIT
jgi:hypothetical protein